MALKKSMAAKTLLGVSGAQLIEMQADYEGPEMGPRGCWTLFRLLAFWVDVFCVFLGGWGARWFWFRRLFWDRICFGAFLQSLGAFGGALLRCWRDFLVNGESSFVGPCLCFKVDKGSVCLYHVPVFCLLLGFVWAGWCDISWICVQRPKSLTLPVPWGKNQMLLATSTQETLKHAFGISLDIRKPLRNRIHKLYLLMYIYIYT